MISCGIQPVIDMKKERKRSQHWGDERIIQSDSFGKYYLDGERFWKVFGMGGRFEPKKERERERKKCFRRMVFGRGLSFLGGGISPCFKNDIWAAVLGIGPCLRMNLGYCFGEIQEPDCLLILIVYSPHDDNNNNNNNNNNNKRERKWKISAYLLGEIGRSGRANRKSSTATGGAEKHHRVLEENWGELSNLSCGSNFHLLFSNISNWFRLFFSHALLWMCIMHIAKILFFIFYFFQLMPLYLIFSFWLFKIIIFLGIHTISLTFTNYFLWFI